MSPNPNPCDVVVCFWPTGLDFDSVCRGICLSVQGAAGITAEDAPFGVKIWPSAPIDLAYEVFSTIRIVRALHPECGTAELPLQPGAR